jgi:hypothetical protein
MDRKGRQAVSALILFVTISAIVASRVWRRDAPVSPRRKPVSLTLMCYCADCDARAELTTEGRCGRCSSVAIALVSSLPPLSPDHLPALRLADEAERERVRGEKRDDLRRSLRRA